jgi:hypothetical protein
MAAGTHTLTASRSAKPNPLGEIETGWVGSTDDGTVPTLAVTFPCDCELLSLFTDAVASATDDYDITALDANGIDRLQGVGADRDTVNPEEAQIVFASTSLHPTVRSGESLTVTLANNSDTSSSGVIIIRYRALANV